jgi:hypothetical protein
MDGFCCKRPMTGHTVAVLSLAVVDTILYSGGADGKILMWSCDSLTMVRPCNAYRDTQLRTMTWANDTIQALVWQPAFKYRSPLNAASPPTPSLHFSSSMMDTGATHAHTSLVFSGSSGNAVLAWRAAECRAMGSPRAKVRPRLALRRRIVSSPPR